MKIVLVGRGKGQRKIQWIHCVLLCLVLSLIMGLGVLYGAYFLFHWWKPANFFSGMLLGLGLVIVGLIGGLQTPLEKLTPLDQ